MLIDLLKKYIPDTEKLKAHKNLQFLGARLHEPNLWHINRRSVAMAFAVGLFCAWIPTPGQMAIAALIAFYVSANLPISVGLVWITNPITMPPLFYFAYRFGLWLTGRPSPADNFQFSVEGVFSGLSDIWQPFLLGCFVIGVVCAAAGYFGIHYFWRKNISARWWRRQQKKAGIIVPEPIHPLQKTWDVLQTWLSAHPEAKNNVRELFKHSITFVSSAIKRAGEFVPFK